MKATEDELTKLKAAMEEAQDAVYAANAAAETAGGAARDAAAAARAAARAEWVARDAMDDYYTAKARK
jgi:hypothetical protein